MPTNTPTPYALTIARLREDDRAATRRWDALADERSAGLAHLLARSRALRTIGQLTLPSASVEPSGLLAQASSTRKLRAAAAELANVRRRDAIAAADTYTLTGPEIDERVRTATLRAVPGANRDERNDAASYVMERIARKYGWDPRSCDVAPRWCERLASGFILDERQRAARQLTLAEEREERDEHRDDDAAAAQLAAGRNVWADAGAVPLDSDAGAAALRAVEVSADELGDALQAQAQRPVSASMRAAIGAALNGYGSGAELAAALGISEGAARKRLHDGRALLRSTFPTADELADALADALATLDSDRVRLTSLQRKALAAVGNAQRSEYRRARVTCTGSGLYGLTG